MPCRSRGRKWFKPAAPAGWLQSRPSPMDQWRWDRYGNDRWYEGWYQRKSGLWWHTGWPQPWDQDKGPWYPRDRKAVLDANGNRVDPVAAVAAGEDVEWEATMQKWGDAAMGGDDDRSGLFDHSLMSQNEVIADAEKKAIGERSRKQRKKAIGKTQMTKMPLRGVTWRLSTTAAMTKRPRLSTTWQQRPRQMMIVGRPSRAAMPQRA